VAVINCDFIACNSQNHRAQWAWDWLKVTWQMSLQKEGESHNEKNEQGRHTNDL